MSRKIIFIALLMATPTGFADVSGNVGFQSDYIFRGVPQSPSSAQGGLDYENGGFYLGTWAADVGAGAEVDVYGGFGWEVDDFSFGIGATGYYYTDDFDDTYQEINLSFGYGGFSIDYAKGDYENFAGPTLDYNFLSATYEHDSGFYGIVGNFGDQADGTYYTLGYGFSIEGIDFAIDWIYSDEKLSGATLPDSTVGVSESNIVFTIGKSFDIGKSQ